MKRLLLVMALLLPLLAQAQNAQVAQIRKQYAEAKQHVADAERLQKEGQPGYILTVTNSYQMPGCGPTNETIHYYYNGRYEEEVETVVYQPYLITRQSNVAANKFYQEFLFDKDGNTTFFFEKMNADETRYYYASSGLVHEIVKGQRQMDDVFALRLATDLKEAFDKLMNRNY
ncbi:MAG: hypothetical protein IJ588_04195 [Prevotella sp.]|nr:hypothetical protein [Prevotella sp.]